MPLLVGGRGEKKSDPHASSLPKKHIVPPTYADERGSPFSADQSSTVKVASADWNFRQYRSAGRIPREETTPR